ncbi:MAG: DNA repair protein RadA [Waddliaceae bacterium]|nr:DNA repair protein RadA [Waddliaceae bacterium]
MAKVQSVWCCVECGQQQRKWSGQCPQCKQWDTLHEEAPLPQKDSRFESKTKQVSKPIPINDIQIGETPRVKTHIAEFDRVMGGGVVPGSFSLVGGDPGIGKSTLMLQVASNLASQGLVVLYISGEESVEQTSLRAKRLGVESNNLLLVNETDFSTIRSHIHNVNADVVVIDSIQVVYKAEISSAPGSVSQVRETAAEFMHLAKGHKISIFLIGHVTKSGELAGPRVLEHLVDTVLYFEGDKHHNYRMTRVIKNRFGTTDEIAVFQMSEKGLQQVPNPSEIFLEERMRGVVGSVIVPTIEGSRPFLVEVQSLVSDTVFPTPSRRSTGLDQNRLALLLAVLEKRIGYQLHTCDVFVSVAGGIKIIEPAADLAVALSIASSLCNRTVDPDTIVLGEVGLGGEVRSVPRIEIRVKEAIQMGFKRAWIPKRNLKGLSNDWSHQIELHGADFVEEVIHALLQ